MAGGAGSGISKGGMNHQGAGRAACRTQRRKHADRQRARSGCIVAPRPRRRTRHLAVRHPLRRWRRAKQWLADHLQLAGSLQLDDGAIRALQDGKSLLPIGVTQVSGEFERGAVVACRTAQGKEISRGLINYSSSDARRIAQHSTHEIEAILGYLDEEVLIHRDNMVLL